MKMQTRNLPDKGIVHSNDGVYRWVYEFNMYRNPAILLTVWKVLLLSFGIVWLFTVCVTCFEDGFHLDAIWELTKVLLLVFAFVGILLTAVAYLILAKIYGGRYCVLFEMDEEGVRHTQLAKQFKKAQVIGTIAALAGVAAGKTGTIGTGLLAGSKNTSYSEFSKVRKVKTLRRFNTIKVNELLEHNQVYVRDEDYDFVLNWILERVPEKVRKGVH